MSIIDDAATKVTVKASCDELVVSEITTNGKAVRQLARIVFRKAYAIGSFSGGDIKKVQKGFDMMLLDLMDNRSSDDVKKLIDILSQ